MTADQGLLLPRASWEVQLAPISRVTVRRECRKENGTDTLLRKDDKRKRKGIRRWGSNHRPSVISHINKSVIVKPMTSISSVLCIHFGKMARF